MIPEEDDEKRFARLSRAGFNVLSGGDVISGGKHNMATPVGAGPYLDRISISQHLPQHRSDPWNHLLIQPISIPDLSHTGLRTAFTYGETMLRPDGSVSGELRESINHRVRNLPRDPVYDTLDMKRRDVARSMRRTRRTAASRQMDESTSGIGEFSDTELGTTVATATTGGGGSASVAEEEEMMSSMELSASRILNSSSVEKQVQASMQRKGRRRRKPRPALGMGSASRKKRPYSNQSLFDCLMDARYGSPVASSSNDPNEFTWDVDPSLVGQQGSRR